MFFSPLFVERNPQNYFQVLCFSFGVSLYLPIAMQILHNLQNTLYAVRGWRGHNELRWYVGDTTFLKDVYGMCCTYLKLKGVFVSLTPNGIGMCRKTHNSRQALLF